MCFLVGVAWGQDGVKNGEKPGKAPDGTAKTPDGTAKTPGKGVKTPGKGVKTPGKAAVNPKKTKSSLPVALKIMKLRASRSLPADEKSTVDLRVEENGRFDKKRSLVRYVLRKNGKEKSLFRFTSPANFRNLAVLTLENDDGDDQQYMYIPRRRKVKRVPRSQSVENFAGGGFAFEDFRAEALDAHSYKTLGKKKIQGRPTYMIEAKPKAGEVRALKGYGRRILYVDAERYVIMRVEFYDKNDRFLKIQENSRWAVVGGVYRPYRAKMKELTRDRTTWVKFKTWAANEGLSAKLFTTRELKREGAR
jgi:hypothetical protein